MRSRTTDKRCKNNDERQPPTGQRAYGGALEVR